MWAGVFEPINALFQQLSEADKTQVADKYADKILDNPKPSNLDFLVLTVLAPSISDEAKKLKAYDEIADFVQAETFKSCTLEARAIILNATLAVAESLPTNMALKILENLKEMRIYGFQVEIGQLQQKLMSLPKGEVFLATSISITEDKSQGRMEFNQLIERNKEQKYLSAEDMAVIDCKLKRNHCNEQKPYCEAMRHVIQSEKITPDIQNNALINLLNLTHMISKEEGLLIQDLCRKTAQAKIYDKPKDEIAEPLEPQSEIAEPSELNKIPKKLLIPRPLDKIQLHKDFFSEFGMTFNNAHNSDLNLEEKLQITTALLDRVSIDPAKIVEQITQIKLSYITPKEISAMSGLLAKLSGHLSSEQVEKIGEFISENKDINNKHKLELRMSLGISQRSAYANKFNRPLI